KGIVMGRMILDQCFENLDIMVMEIHIDRSLIFQCTDKSIIENFPIRIICAHQQENILFPAFAGVDNKVSFTRDGVDSSGRAKLIVSFKYGASGDGKLRRRSIDRREWVVFGKHSVSNCLLDG